MDKPKIHEAYWYIYLDPEDMRTWCYAVRENRLDQDDLYNIASRNWAMTQEALLPRTFDILSQLTGEGIDVVMAMMAAGENTRLKGKLANFMPSSDV